MTRILAVLMTASLAMAACDGGVPQSVSSPSASVQPTSSATDNAQFAVGGMVQSIEKPTRAISGAVVEITQGLNAGKTAVSDETGSFAIYGLSSGSVMVRVTKSGYQAWTSKGFQLQSDTKIAIELFPMPPSNDSGASATGRCNDGSWTWASSYGAACANNGGLAYGVCPGPLCKAGA